MNTQSTFVKSIFGVIMLVVLMLLPDRVWAQFNDGYLTVFKVTSGSALAGTGTAIITEEYLPTGASQTNPDYSVSLPTTGANRVVVAGTSTTAGAMTRSENGRYLIIPGYDVAVTTAITNAGALRTIDASGNVGVGIAGTFYSTAGDLRGSVSDDGTKFWTSGATTGIRYSNNGTSVTTVSTTSTNTRVVNIFNGQLFYSAAAGTNGIYQVGTGKPITTGNTSVIQAPSTSPNGFSVSPDGLTIYAFGSSSTIVRFTYSGTYNSSTFTYSGGTWSSGSTGFTLASANGVAVDWNGYSFSTGVNGAKIYACSPTTLVSGNDNGTGAITTTTLRTISGFNAFRGLAFSPIKQTVSLGSNSPVTGNIIQGNTNTVLFQFNLNANEGNSTIKKLILAQSGTATIGAGNSISNFRLLYDANSNGIADAGEISASLSTGTVSGANITFSSISQTYINQGSSNNYLVIGDISITGTGTFIPAIVSNKSLNSVNYTTNLVNAGGSWLTIGATAPTGNTLTIVSGGLLSPPTLTPDATLNDVDHNIDITFPTDGAWEAAITFVKIGGTALTVTTDYVITAGNLQLKPSGGNSLLTTPGSKSVTVLADGYTDASITQMINIGAPSANSTATISAALAPNTSQTITCTAKDQFNNLVSGYTFKYDATITNNDPTIAESYTIDGTARATTTNDLSIITSTNGSGVATFTAALPATIDGNDGISIQVQLNNGTTNIGSAFSYTQLLPQTITFGALSPVTYGDAPFLVSASGGGSGNPVTFTSSNSSIATCTGTNGTTVTIVAPGTCTINANQAGNGSYNAAPQVGQSLLVNVKPLTIPDAVAQDKAYTGTNAAVITGTLSGIVSPDVVTLNGTGTFADVNVANGIAVTSTSTLGGTDFAKYSLTQPTGLSANITQANQTITFAPLANKVEGSAPFDLSATASSALPVSYTISNENVAMISGITVTIIGVGVTTITASQSGDGNYFAASSVDRTLTVTKLPIAAWDFTGIGGTTIASTPATTFNSNLVSTSNANYITRGTGAGWSIGSNSWRTQGFQNNGIAITNTDYFSITIKAASGNKVSLSTIDANLSGTQSFVGTGGVSSQFSYSTDGTNFILIGSPEVLTGTVPITMTQINLSGISALQNVAAGTTIYLRYYASGQTTTGGWGFYSSASGTNGLAIGGDVLPLEPTVTTQAVSSKTSISATGNGNITDIGGAAPTTRGFCWDLSTNADPTTALSTKTVETGTFSTGAFTGSIAGLTGNTSYKVRAYATNSGGTAYGSPVTFTTDASATCIFTGASSTAWENAGNWDNGLPGAITNVTIPANKLAVVNSTGYECNNLVVEPLGELTVTATKDLSVNGVLTVQSSAAGTGSVVEYGGLVVGGDATVQRYFTGAAESWHQLSSPVDAQAISGGFTPSGTYPDLTGYDFYAWHEQTSAWVNFKNTSVAPTWNTANGNTNFTVGRGYLVAYQIANPTKEFVGNLNTGAVSYTLAKTGAGTYTSYNLVGNPYCSAIDWKASGWNRTNLVGNAGVDGYDMYIWNDASGNYGSFNSLAASGSNGASQYIPVGQGFMVKALSNGAAFGMDNGVRVHNTQSFLKTTDALANILRMKVAGDANSYSDEIVVEFGHATDNGGAGKMFSMYETAPSLYTVKSTGNYSIDFRGEAGATTIPVSFKAGADGTYTLTASQLETFASWSAITLEDLKAAKTQNLMQNPVYSFTASTGDAQARFLLHFGGAFSVNDRENVQPISVHAVGNTILVTSKTGNALTGNVTVYNMIGQQLIHQSLNGNTVTQLTLNTPTGYYLVKVVTNDHAYTTKVFVNN